MCGRSTRAAGCKRSGAWISGFRRANLWRHEPFHGVHHQHAGVPHAELPLHTASLAPKRPDELPPFRSYTHAFGHLFRSLADPRIGPQWREVEARAAEAVGARG